MSHQFSRDQVQASTGSADNAHAGGWVSNSSLKAESRTGLHGHLPLEIGLGSLGTAEFLLHAQARDMSLKHSSTQDSHRFIECTLKKDNNEKFFLTYGIDFVDILSHPCVSQHILT